VSQSVGVGCRPAHRGATTLGGPDPAVSACPLLRGCFQAGAAHAIPVPTHHTSGPVRHSPAATTSRSWTGWSHAGRMRGGREPWRDAAGRVTPSRGSPAVSLPAGVPRQRVGRLAAEVRSESRGRRRPNPRHQVAASQSFREKIFSLSPRLFVGRGRHRQGHRPQEREAHGSMVAVRGLHAEGTLPNTDAPLGQAALLESAIT